MPDCRLISVTAALESSRAKANAIYLNGFPGTVRFVENPSPALWRRWWASKITPVSKVQSPG